MVRRKLLSINRRTIDVQRIKEKEEKKKDSPKESKKFSTRKFLASNFS